LRVLKKAMAVSVGVGMLIALGSTSLMSLEGGEADHRVTICHVDGQGRFHKITVDRHAVPAHLAHGDMFPDEHGDCSRGGDYHEGDD